MKIFSGGIGVKKVVSTACRSETKYVVIKGLRKWIVYDLGVL